MKIKYGNKVKIVNNDFWEGTTGIVLKQNQYIGKDSVKGKPEYVYEVNIDGKPHSFHENNLELTSETYLQQKVPADTEVIKF